MSFSQIEDAFSLLLGFTDAGLRLIGFAVGKICHLLESPPQKGCGSCALGVHKIRPPDRAESKVGVAEMAYQRTFVLSSGRGLKWQFSRSRLMSFQDSVIQGNGPDKFSKSDLTEPSLGEEEKRKERETENKKSSLF